jgi:hypothetical protein
VRGKCIAQLVYSALLLRGDVLFLFEIGGSAGCGLRRRRGVGTGFIGSPPGFRGASLGGVRLRAYLADLVFHFL